MGEMSHETKEERAPGSGMSLAESGTTKELSWTEDEVSTGLSKNKILCREADFSNARTTGTRLLGLRNGQKEVNKKQQPV